MPEMGRFDLNEDIEKVIRFVSMEIVRVNPAKIDPEEMIMNVIILRALKELLVYHRKIDKSRAKVGKEGQ